MVYINWIKIDDFDGVFSSLTCSARLLVTLHPGELRKIATAAYNRSRQSDLQDETIFPASIHREGLTRLSNDDIIYRS